MNPCPRRPCANFRGSVTGDFVRAWYDQAMPPHTIHGFQISLFLVAISVLATPLRADVTIYVAPDGNDGWSGEFAAPNDARTDGPLATPAKARDVLRAAHGHDVTQPATVFLRGGVCFLSEPLALNSRDSGTVAAPVTWTAYKDETPIISAGRRITGWQKTTVNGHDAWMAKLPPANGAFLFRELWVNGQRAPRARWPRTGTLAVAQTPKAKNNTQWRHPESQFQLNTGDLKAWPSAPDGEAVVMSRWVESRLPIAAINEKENRLESSKPAGFAPETGDRYYIENVKETLSEPGEWYLDPREHVIYFIAPSGVDPNAAQIIVPRLPQVLRLEGSASGGGLVSNINFRGITFSNSEWYYDCPMPGQKAEPTLTSYPQAAIGVPGAVWGQGVRSCTFDHCTIAHVGGYGIELGRGCQNNRILHCTITDLAAGGVKLGETQIRENAEDQAFGNEVCDCRITDGGCLFPSAVGAWIGQSHDNTVMHNEIARFWYTGVSVGWTWGYGNSLSQNNHIEFNDIHHIGIKHKGDAPILSDMGGIYTLGNEKGTVILHNHFHDIGAIKYGGWGIYFDEGTTDILAENNLVCRTTHGGFHQHYGKDNIVRNNIFALGRDAQIQRTRLEDHRSFTFENNIVYYSTGVLLTGNWDKLNVAFDHNTYWKTGGGEIRFAKYTWPQWRAAGMDVHSKIADPRFKDPEHNDFYLTAESAKDLGGFVPFELDGVGPRHP